MEISQLLKHLNEDFFKAIEIDENRPRRVEIDQSVFTNKWLGFPPASEISIVEKERQLGTNLPPSYREFLLFSNGFRNISPFIFNLYSIEKIDWAKNTEDPWWLDLIESDPSNVSDEDYLIYDDTQRSEWDRPEYFRKSLKISDWGDACCLFLNPMIKHDNEWEVLFYATWYPGTHRYRSFKEFLNNTYDSNQELYKIP
jgi:hypothetical protein